MNNFTILNPLLVVEKHDVIVFKLRYDSSSRRLIYPATSYEGSEYGWSNIVLNNNYETFENIGEKAEIYHPIIMDREGVFPFRARNGRILIKVFDTIEQSDPRGREIKGFYLLDFKNIEKFGILGRKED